MSKELEIRHRVSKEDYKAQAHLLRQSLLEAQYRLLDQAKFPAIIVIGGLDGAGKGDTVNLFNAWMDPRHISTHGFGKPSTEEIQRPPMWRFWHALPPKGRISMLFGSWYGPFIDDYVSGNIGATELDATIATIQHFENMLTTDGALLIKLWFDLSRDAQRQRLKELEEDPKTRWRVTDTDWLRYQNYDKYRDVSTRMLDATNSAQAPWNIIDGSDARYRALASGNILLNSLRQHLDTTTQPARTATTAVPAPSPAVLRNLDYTLQLERKEYESQLETWQGRLNQLLRDKHFQKKSLVVVFEGQDAAGKGGAIRRVTAALDARQYTVIPIAAPSDEERARPYLWRFWRQLPRRGHVALFDRSWYGRVLVERVEQFASEADWQRAYDEINDFEAQMASHDVIVVKFWLAITKDEQLARFREREEVSFKKHKITAEDWRNREKWDDYEIAVNDMVARTSTRAAPWTLIPANNAEYARVTVLKTLCQRVKEALSD